MTLSSELKNILEDLGVSVETGVFSSTPPNRYTVLTPICDTFDLFTDNMPEQDVQEIRISLFDKGNYLTIKRQIEKAILSAEIMITDRRYIGHSDETGYHHYAIDVAKNYEIKEET